MTQPAVFDPVSGQPKQPVTQYGDNMDGHRTSITDTNGRVTKFRFDQFGRSTGRTLPDGKSESTAYDAFGATDYHIDCNGATVDLVYDAGSGLGTQKCPIFQGFRVAAVGF